MNFTKFNRLCSLEATREVSKRNVEEFNKFNFKRLFLSLALKYEKSLNLSSGFKYDVWNILTGDNKLCERSRKK